MKILIAPNSFKECAGPVEIAYIINSELFSKKLTDNIICPVSDGGDDFLGVYNYHFPTASQVIHTRQCFSNDHLAVPLGFDSRKHQYILESADIIGLKIIPSAFRNPMKLNSENLGYIFTEIEHQDKNAGIIMGLGGTGTSDLGLGLCVPFGLKLLDHNGNELDVIPENFIITQKLILPRRTDLNIEAVLDVTIPLTGRHGCVQIFAGQKGASDKDKEVIDAGYENILKILKKDCRIDFTGKDMGAAGGLSVGLSLISKLKPVPSHSFLNNTLGITDKIGQCDFVITAEGRFDEQSLMNKASGVIISQSLEQKKKTAVITGECNFQFLNDPRPVVIELIKLMGSKEKAMTRYREALGLAVDSLLAYIPT